MTDQAMGKGGPDVRKVTVDQLRALAEEASTGTKFAGGAGGVDVLPNWPKRRWLRRKKSH